MIETIDEDLDIIDDRDFNAYTVHFGPVEVYLNATGNNHAMTVANVNEYDFGLQPRAAGGVIASKIHPDDGRELHTRQDILTRLFFLISFRHPRAN